MNKRSSGVINMLCYSAVEEERLSSGDVLFHCGELAKKMFFVAEGKLAYLRETHDMVSLYPGQWCSEIILWCPWVHRGDMHARTDCTVLALDSERFREVVLSFPADLWLPRRYCKAFCKHLQEMCVSNRSLTESVGLDDIQVGKLDLKKILNSIIDKAINESQGDETSFPNEDEDDDNDGYAPSERDEDAEVNEGAAAGDGMLNSLAVEKPNTTKERADHRLLTTTISLDSSVDVDKIIGAGQRQTTFESQARSAQRSKSICTMGSQGTIVSFAGSSSTEDTTNV